MNQNQQLIRGQAINTIRSKGVVKIVIEQIVVGRWFWAHFNVDGGVDDARYGDDDVNADDLTMADVGAAAGDVDYEWRFLGPFLGHCCWLCGRGAKDALCRPPIVEDCIPLVNRRCRAHLANSV